MRAEVFYFRQKLSNFATAVAKQKRNCMLENVDQQFELGAWVGRSQAFGLVANHCSAAQARCLQNLRESDQYKSKGLNWTDFCLKYVGVSRQRVDVLIQSLDEFGDTYFNLSRIVAVSPETYRQIAGNIEGEQIEINGEKVPIVPENAARIRAAVTQMRVELNKKQQRKAAAKSAPSMDELAARTLASLESFLPIIRNPLSREDQARLGELLRGIAGKVGQLHRELNQR
jgi:hypothetical protein